MSSITDQFTMGSHINIYVVSIGNEDPSLESYAVQLLWDKPKRAISSSMTLTLSLIHSSLLTSLEENCALFNQYSPLLEPTTDHHEVFTINNPDKLSNFVQFLKGPDRVNGIKGAFAQYENNSSFGILTSPFNLDNLPITTRIL